MTTTHITTLRTALETAYINGATASSLAYRPQFVSNNHKEGKKVLSSVEDELLACDQFQISVAFITMSGITPLLQTLKELEKKNIPGEILTTNYLNFSEPRALKKLNELQNITLKMYAVEAAKENAKLNNLDNCTPRDTFSKRKRSTGLSSEVPISQVQR